MEESLRVLRLLVVNLLRLFVNDSLFCDGEEMGSRYKLDLRKVCMKIWGIGLIPNVCLLCHNLSEFHAVLFLLLAVILVDPRPILLPCSFFFVSSRTLLFSLLCSFILFH